MKTRRDEENTEYETYRCKTTHTACECVLRRLGSLQRLYQAVRDLSHTVGLPLTIREAIEEVERD
jgi:hypothetical protein